jgi:predicted TIM-barrel fold metal-dependent hydrolase
MVVDVNAFIGKWPYWPVPAATTEAAVSKFAQWGIDRACICSTRSLFVNWEDGNRDVEIAVIEHPDVLVPFACLGTFELSHRAANRKHDLKAYRERGFRGVRLYPQHHSYHLLVEPFVDEICDQAEALKLPVLLSLRAIMNWGVPTLDLREIVDIVERHPRTPWILSGINYLHEIRSAIYLLRRYASVHLETSCVMGYEAIQKAVNECGWEQILFGSAAPLQHGRADLEKILHARITDAAREAIFAGNAKRLLNLEN